METNSNGVVSVRITSKHCVELVDWVGNDATIVRSARVSTGKDNTGVEGLSDRDRGLIRRLIKDGHTSTLEHCSVTFMVETPIFVAREFMRHRTLSFSEISSRYSVMEPKFYLPSEARPKKQVGKSIDYNLVPFNNDIAECHVENRMLEVFTEAYAQYLDLLDYGVAKEVARMLLPVSLMTRFYVTGNLNNWFKFLNLRLDSKAQYEIRDVAKQIEAHLHTLFPVAVDAYNQKQ